MDIPPLMKSASPSCTGHIRPQGTFDHIIIECHVQAWSPYHVNDVNDIQDISKIQRRATIRKVTNHQTFSCTFWGQETKREVDMTVTFKILNGLEHILMIYTWHVFIMSHNRETRGHNFKIFKKGWARGWISVKKVLLPKRPIRGICTPSEDMVNSPTNSNQTLVISGKKIDYGYRKLGRFKPIII